MNRGLKTIPTLPGRGALAALLLLASACDRPSGAPASGSQEIRAIRVKTVKPCRQTVARKIQLPATVRARFEVTLYAKATGFVKSITKDRGDRVKPGEIIATLEVPELLLEMEHARASFAMEDSTLKRLDAIRKMEKTAVTDQDLDLARAKRAMADASLKRLQTLVDYMEIRAPFGGYVTERFIDPGAFVQQSKIVSIVDASVVRVVVDVPEAETGHASLGTDAEVRFDALPAGTVQAQVSRSSSALDPLSRTMRIEIDVPNPENKILPGMFARVNLGVERRINALVVPAKAILLQHDRSYVFVNVGGNARKLAVTTGTLDGEWCETCSGLTGEELVLVPDGQVLVEGMPVQAAEETP